MTAEPARAERLPAVWARVTDEIVVRGEGAWLHTQSGRRMLDFTSGIGVTNTGHCHPRVVEAVRRQAGELLFGQMNCAASEAVLRTIEALSPIAPAGLDSFFFSNSGAEAVEGAIKLARRATSRPNVIALQGGFHGRTAMAMALTSGKTAYRQGYQPLPAGVFIGPFPYAMRYRDAGVGDWDEDRLVRFCLNELRSVLATQTAPHETAAILLEPVLGEGGYVAAPHSFTRGLREICDEHRILLIIDEIQSGFGRTGDWWRHSESGVVPDILTMAKGIASGLPMSAIAASSELMSHWGPGAHGGTYGGGSAVAHAAAVATIDAIRDEGLLSNSQDRGGQLSARLAEIAETMPELREVRGPGLMIGCEFQSEGRGASLAAAITKRCEGEGLLLLTCGAKGQVVRWIPPLTVSESEIDQAVDIFEKSARGAIDARVE